MTRLHRRAHRARVGDVVAEVRAVVDAGRDEVEPVAEVAEERDAHRIGRRAVDRVGERAVAEGPLADAQRAHQRLLVADRTLVRVRRDDRDVADRVERVLEREQPARLDPVVVGDEDARPAAPVVERLGAPCAAPADRRARRPRRPARRAPCRGRAARSGPARGSCPGGRRSGGPASPSVRSPPCPVSPAGRALGRRTGARVVDVVEVGRAAGDRVRAGSRTAGPRAR